jgi:hypothetical protein
VPDENCILLLVDFLTWLMQGALGPALFGLPVTLAGPDLASAARRWFKRLRRSDGLSRIVRAAAGADVHLSEAEFAEIRHLLEQDSTWIEVGRGTVEDLAILITGCFRDPASESSLSAGRAIAAGLLEFSVRSIEPEWFPQVLFARLDRIQADQASALDREMVKVHADLAALFAVRSAANEDRFAYVTGQLARVLNRLPSGPADEDDVALYLAALIGWLNSDPWPRHPEFAGPELTPAAIERKLSIAGGGSGFGENLDADELGRQCSRLVVLGGPGSGKTWLAKRTARLCAEAALQALEGGATLEEVELPLYTTCARLSKARPGESSRRAAVASALGHLPDLGGERIRDALQMLFEERNTPTLLVADSLDETQEADDRIGTLPQAWRIMLTTRPAAWNHQLAIKGDDQGQRVGILQPLRYPDDVEPFIDAWFGEQHSWASAYLAAQLRDRPSLQQAATVPLILAFYCIIGGRQPLPSRRTKLYADVIEHMLIGPWRGRAHQFPDSEECLEILRDWAWSAAKNNPVSGVGKWEDEFPTRKVKRSQEHTDALDHVAVPLPGAPGDFRTTRRRFVHRSLREHLVAEHVALMSAEEAARELLNHLWYDPDWEYAAPAALAMHPQRNQVLQELIRQVTGVDQFRADIACVDGCWQIRRFLARVAQESSEAEWSAEAAGIIERARSDLARSPQENLGQVVATDWPASNRLITELLLNLLADETNQARARDQADTVARFAVTAEDRVRASEALVALIAGIADSGRTLGLPRAVVALAVTAQERARAREALLGLLAVETEHTMAWVLAGSVALLDPAAEDLARTREALLRLLADGTDPVGMAGALAQRVARLDPTAEDLVRVREVLLGLLANQIWPDKAAELADAVAGLGPAPGDLARAREALFRLIVKPLTDTTPFGRDSHQASYWTHGLADAVARLAVTAEDRAEAREALLGILADATSRGWTLGLPDAITRLAVTAEDRAGAREALLGFLADATMPEVAQQLADAVAQLDPAPEDLAKAREALIKLLADVTNREWAGKLPDAIARIAVTAEDRTKTKEAVLKLLADPANLGRCWELAKTVAQLAVTAEDLAGAREALLGLLADPANRGWAGGLAGVITDLDPTEADLARAREALLGLLADTTDDFNRTHGLARMVAQLAVTAEDQARARQGLLGLLDNETNSDVALQLANAVAQLDPTAADRARAREALLGLLANSTWSDEAVKLADAVARLDPATEDLARARLALLGLLTEETKYFGVFELARKATRPESATGDRAEARNAFLGLLADEIDPDAAQVLADAIIGLDPTADDRAKAKDALLLLAGKADPKVSRELTETIARLDPTAEDPAKANEVLLELAGEIDPLTAGELMKLAETVARLGPTAEDRAKANEALLGLLANQTDPKTTKRLAETMARLDPTAEDRAKDKEALLGPLASQTDPKMAHEQADAIVGLNPTVADLEGSDTWPVPPSPALLAAARRNSELPAWLAALRQFSDSSGTAAE